MSAENGQSIQSDILDAVVATLGGNAANIFRCRFSSFATSELPGDNVIPQEEDPEYQDTDGVERKFRFHVRHLAAVTKNAATPADKVADARYVRGAKLLLADITLGSLVRRIREVSHKWEMEQSELDVIARVVTYEVEYSTILRDPSVQGY
ncbi:MAG TPA: hypothetical protein VLI45_09230 [Acidobacteriaceae bacterium]|nr:hypothetical protein [Acidobacteriaceae bacterium]